MSDQAQGINWTEVVDYVQTTGDKNIWPKLSEDERKLYLQALQQRGQGNIANRPDSAMLGVNVGGRNIDILSPEDAFGAAGIVRGVKGILNKGVPQITKQGLGRVSREGGGVVDGPGLPATIKANASKHVGGKASNPPNLEKLGRQEFTEVEKRANMFGGARMEGQAVKPNARAPMTIQDEAAQLIQEIMKGKTGGALPNTAKRGAKLRSPK